MMFLQCEFELALLIDQFFIFPSYYSGRDWYFRVCIQQSQCGLDHVTVTCNRNKMTCLICSAIDSNWHFCCRYSNQTALPEGGWMYRHSTYQQPFNLSCSDMYVFGIQSNMSDVWLIAFGLSTAPTYSLISF